MVSKSDEKLKYSFIYCFGGTIYYFFECMIRGFSHWTMFLLGGLCFTMISIINQSQTLKLNLINKMILCSIVITLLEFITGLLVNVWLKWNIWDYSHLPGNIMGQISIPFTLLWFVLSYIAILLDDYIRLLFFGEKIIHHKRLKIPKSH